MNDKVFNRVKGVLTDRGRSYKLSMKVLFNYYKALLTFNILFSGLIGLLGGVSGENKIIGFLNVFMFSFCTGGYFLALFFYELRYKSQYYFYYNKGYSKTALIILSYLFNLLILILFFLLKSMAAG
ncbi:hypothetical protein [Chitinophaga sp. MM2321]|uniref:hypothetical protein n=1 Tax=Chitinophaga sp. MM2321 TaxID=3137178 RepID=UPI0032D56E46